MKKGFTLIELLGAIFLIGIFGIITGYVVTNIIKTSELKVYQKNENLLKEKARNYVLSSDLVLPVEVGDSIIVELSTLKQEGFIEKMTDPKDSSIDCDGRVYVFKALEKTYEYIPFLQCGNNYVTTTPVLNDSNIESISHTTVGNVNTITVNLSANNKIGSVFLKSRKIGIYRPTSLDYRQWSLGSSGSQGSFGRNGTDVENTIITKKNPWGREDIVWANLSNDVTSNDDGGWNVNNLPIDSTKTYRLSVWIRREDAYSSVSPSIVTGRTYFGTQGSTVYNLGTTTINTNPYFRSNLISEIPNMVDNWLLWVAHIHPSTYSGSSSSLSGVYKLDGTKLAGMTDFKWITGQTIGGHRVYMYYSTSINEKQFYYRPRMEVVQSTTPSIQDLLNGVENPEIYGHTETITNNTISHSYTGKGIVPITIKMLDGSVKIIPYVIN